MHRSFLITAAVFLSASLLQAQAPKAAAKAAPKAEAKSDSNAELVSVEKIWDKAPHSAFTDPTAPADAPPRESIEFRTIAFFD